MTRDMIWLLLMQSSDFAPPVYHQPTVMHPTMTEDKYQPKGAWGTPGRRSWRKYEAWKPQ